jgi:adenylyl- and sulfurtransferase ThiI
MKEAQLVSLLAESLDSPLAGWMVMKMEGTSVSRLAEEMELLIP